jgi:hypothetical protein
MAGDTPDYTAFYAANEEAAKELRRLLEAGALARLVAILRRAGVRLELESYSRALGQSEFLGALEPGEGEGEELFPFEDFLADRVEQVVALADGRRARVRMPDHICPLCGNDRDNYIVETKKTCAGCRFQW